MLGLDTNVHLLGCSKCLHMLQDNPALFPEKLRVESNETEKFT